MILKVILKKYKNRTGFYNDTPLYYSTPKYLPFKDAIYLGRYGKLINENDRFYLSFKSDHYIKIINKWTHSTRIEEIMKDHSKYSSLKKELGGIPFQVLSSHSFNKNQNNKVIINCKSLNSIKLIMNSNNEFKPLFFYQARYSDEKLSDHKDRVLFAYPRQIEKTNTKKTTYGGDSLPVIKSLPLEEPQQTKPQQTILKNITNTELLKDAFQRKITDSEKDSVLFVGFNNIYYDQSNHNIFLRNERLAEGNWTSIFEMSETQIVDHFAYGLTSHSLNKLKTKKTTWKSKIKTIRGGASSDTGCDSYCDQQVIQYSGRKIIGFSNTFSYINDTNAGHFSNPIKKELLNMFEHKQERTIRILTLISAPLSYMYGAFADTIGQKPRNLQIKADLICNGFIEHSVAFKQIMENNLPEFKIYIDHLHLSEPQLEYHHQDNVPDNIRPFTNPPLFEASFNAYSASKNFNNLKIVTEDISQEWDTYLNQYDMIYCYGGETHWLLRQMKRTGFAQAIQRNKEIIWSGFSAGIIVAGDSTWLAASKLYSTHTNPNRSVPYVYADDLTPLLKSDLSGNCTMNDIYINNEGDLRAFPPFDKCDFKGLKLYPGLIFPHNNDERWVRMLEEQLSFYDDHTSNDETELFAYEHVILSDSHMFVYNNGKILIDPYLTTCEDCENIYDKANGSKLKRKYNRSLINQGLYDKFN
uniref:Uncharacterized protein n=1 Tax=viral metagenome TaxID=1070528 RepID=A0A6C0BRT6_9ZZZZ